MDAVWYYVANNNQVGPVTLDELKKAAAAGTLAPADLVWQEGTADWVPARTVGELFPATPMATMRPPAVSEPTYTLSPPPPPAPAYRAAPGRPPAPEPLPLDDDEDDRPRPRPRKRRNAAADDGPAAAPAGGMPEWLNLIPVFLKRAFGLDPARVPPTADEDAALAKVGVTDTTARQLAVWRRSMLFVAAVPCALAAVFALIDVIAMEKEAKENLSPFGMFLLYTQALALFALPLAAVFGALTYSRLAVSTKWVLAGGVVSFVVPLAIAFVPADWLLDLPTSNRDTVGAVESRRTMIGVMFGVMRYAALMPAVLSLLPAVARACVRLKLLLPASLVPGWGLVTSAPLCVLLTLATVVLLYHVVGNALLLIGLLLWIGAPLLYLTRFSLLTQPVSDPTERAALANTSLGVLALIVVGVALMITFLFTTKFLGKSLMGTDPDKSHLRPWSLDVLKTWIEYVGRSLFLTVFFADLLLRVALSVWREERAFAATPESVGVDRTMTGLGAAVQPGGGAPPA